MSEIRNLHDHRPGTWADGDKPIDLTSYIDVLVRYRRTFFVVVALVICAGLLYALLSPPVYRADIMVQVEDPNPTPANNAGKLAAGVPAVFDAKPTVAAEVELLRSRMIVGKAVDSLRLDIEATPRYFPLIGAAIAGYNAELSTPGLLGWGGFAWGSESIAVSHLDVSEQMENRKMIVTALGGGKYRLSLASSTATGEGALGTPLNLATESGTASIVISRLDGRPGAQFVVRHVPHPTAVLRLQELLVINERSKQSGVIGVALEGPSASRIAATLNEIANEYVEQNLRRKAAEAEKSVDFLESQLPKLKQQVETAESRYNAARNQRGTIDLSEESKLILSQSVQIQTRLQELRTKRQELIGRFTGNHPTIGILDNQIAGLTAQLNGVTSKIQKLPEVEQNVLRLLRDVKVSTDLYQSLLNDVQQLKLVKASKVGTVRLVDSAETPIKPVRPNRPLVAGAAIVVGLLAGIAVVALRELLDGGISDADEIERQSGLTVYVTIPASAQQARLARVRDEIGPTLLALSRPDDPAIESLRGFRTALQFALQKGTNGVVVISGPGPHIGKSFISANFAVVAATAGKRVVLVDCDLRRGELNHSFAARRTPGVTEWLDGATLDQILQREVAPGLDFIATGSEPPLAADLLQGPRMDALVTELSSRYDLVLIDTPPVLAAPDAGILAPKASAVFLVARADKTTAGELVAAHRAIVQGGGEVKGVLFNGLKIEGRWYRSHNYFGKYRYLNRYGSKSAREA